MLAEGNIPEVSEDELLARYIIASSHVRKSDQTVKPDAFIPHPHRDLSVTRHVQATEDELWLVGMNVATSRGKTLRGRADVVARVCLQQSLSVLAMPLPNNQNHADISGWPAEKPEQKLLAIEIAKAAKLVQTPGDATSH